MSESIYEVVGLPAPWTQIDINARGQTKMHSYQLRSNPENLLDQRHYDY